MGGYVPFASELPWRNSPIDESPRRLIYQGTAIVLGKIFIQQSTRLSHFMLCRSFRPLRKVEREVWSRFLENRNRRCMSP